MNVVVIERPPFSVRFCCLGNYSGSLKCALTFHTKLPILIKCSWEGFPSLPFQLPVIGTQFSIVLKKKTRNAKLIKPEDQNKNNII